MQRLTESAKGVFIISATPFTDDGSLDLDSADRLTDFYLERGVDGITILGMMGEAPKLNGQEAEIFVKRIISRVKDQVPVIVGVTSAGLNNMAELVSASMDVGAAGVMVAPIPSLKTDAAIFNYYSDVAEHLGTDVPLCYQDYPLATGVHLSVSCLNRMIQALPQFVMLKHEDWPGLNKISTVRATATQEGHRRISIVCGNGGVFLPQELARGADGAMTGFAFPEMLVEVFRQFRAGKIDDAEDLFEIYLPLVRHEQQPGFGLAVRKEILKRRGAITSAKTRAPGPSLTAEDHSELDRMLSRLEHRLGESGLDRVMPASIKSTG